MGINLFHLFKLSRGAAGGVCKLMWREWMLVWVYKLEAVSTGGSARDYTLEGTSQSQMEQGRPLPVAEAGK